MSALITQQSIAKSLANAAGIEAYNEEAAAAIQTRQCKHLHNPAGVHAVELCRIEDGPSATLVNNVVEQDHRLVKRRMVAALGFQAFHTARATFAGID